MNQKKINKLIIKLKEYVYVAYEKGQLPKILYDNVMGLGTDTQVYVWEKYSELCAYYLKIPGFYTRFQQYIPTIESEIQTRLRELGLV